jgi:hypothetical protein
MMHTLLALSFTGLAWTAEVGRPLAAMPALRDYEAAFAVAFPALAGGHRVVDWKVYAALAEGDLVAYAIAIDPSLGRQREQIKGKGYQIQELDESIKGDARLRAAFDSQRIRMKSMVLYADDGGEDRCQHTLVYDGQEFRLMFGQSNPGDDPQATAMLAPSCSRTLDSGFQINAGRSSRFKCWPSESTTTCGYRLQDMPIELKRVVENDYPKSIKLRWRWRGLGTVTRLRGGDVARFRSEARNAPSVIIPSELALEFVDGEGQVLWRAESRPAPAPPLTGLAR